MSNRLEDLPECSCTYFEDGFELKRKGDSWNHKDIEGKLLADRVIAGASFFGMFLLAIVVLLILRHHINPKYRKALLVGIPLACLLISVGLFIDVAIRINAKPIRLMYFTSQWITRQSRTPPVLDVCEYFPEHAEFESEFDSIKQEVGRATADLSRIPLTKDTFSGENVEIGKDVRVDPDGNEIGWRVLLISAGSTFTKDADRFPTLKRLIAKHADKVLSCAISIIPPETMIPRHVGYYKGLLRYMLAVEVPAEREKVYLCCNDEVVTWEEGKSVMFDDTFPHKVMNRTKQRRIVVYMDIRRPVSGWLLNACHSMTLKLLQNSKAVKDEVSRTEYLVDL